MWRRTWIPGGFPNEVILFVKLTLMALMLIRGMDYAIGDSPSTARRLGAIEAAFPLDIWGAVFLVAASLGFLSMSLRLERGILAAHVIGWIAYWAFGVGIVSDVIMRRFPGEGTAEHLDRSIPYTAVLTAVTLAVVVITAFRSSWRYTPWIATGFAVSFLIAVSTAELDGLRNATILFGVGALHLAMSVGTIAHRRQQQIREEALDTWT